MHHPTDRIAHTMAFVTPVVEHWLEREIAQWVEKVLNASVNRSCLNALFFVFQLAVDCKDARECREGFLVLVRE